MAWTVTATFPFSAPEIGHPWPAAWAAVSNSAGVIPGTVPVTEMTMVVTFHPSPTLSKVAAALTSSRAGGFCMRPRPAERAMEKQAACAAASSSSGLVLPPEDSVRADQETAMEGRAPLVPCTVPCPRKRSFSQTALAVRVAAISARRRTSDLTLRSRPVLAGAPAIFS